MPQKAEEAQPSPPGISTVEETMAPLDDLTPARALPPGVYFSPTKPESVLNYLDRWMAGYAMPDADGLVIEADVYAESPDVLTRRHRPASIRDGEPSWWFLCLCKMQDTCGRPRGERRVAATGGSWKIEQTKDKVECAKTGQTLGFQRNFGFYLPGDGGKNEMLKTVWLMEEYTTAACPEDGVDTGDGKKVLPVLCRIYLSPRDPGRKEEKNHKKKRRRENDDGGNSVATRAMVPAAYFDAIAALLPPSSVRGVVDQEQTHATQEAPPPLLLLPGVLDNDASPGVDDHRHTMNAVPDTYAMPEERQGNTDDGESSQQRDLLLVDEGNTVSQMARDDDFADSSWINELFMALVPSSSVPGSGQEQTQETEEAAPPLPGASDSYQGYEVVPAAYFDPIAVLPPSSVRGVDQEQTTNTEEAPPLLPGASDSYHGEESPEQPDLLLVNEVWQMGRDDVLADSSWIDELY